MRSTQNKDFSYCFWLALLLLGSAGLTSVAASDVLTYHNDNARTGQNLNETTLTPANVNFAQFGLLHVLATQGLVDAQPLYAAGVTITGQGSHNVVFVVTEHDLVYAFDANSGSILWSVSLLGSGETPSDDLSCSQVTPEIGITATPVIDRNLGTYGTMFLVAMSKNGSNQYFHRLHALDLSTGSNAIAPVTISATYPGKGDNSSNGNVVFDPKKYKERAGLLLLNGVVYTAWASHCDSTPYTGWIIGYEETTLIQTSVLNITPNGSEGAIWMSGAGLAADLSGNIYFLAGNGTFDTTLTPAGFPVNGDFGNAFMKLSTAGNVLTPVDYFATYATPTQNSQDMDLGSGGALVLPDMVDVGNVTRQLAVGAGKDNNIYLVNRSNMGKFNPVNDDAIYQKLSGILPGGVWAMPAYFNNTLYYGPVGNPLMAFPFTNAKLASSSSHSATNFVYPGATPSISANGSANGIVWVTENTSPAVLHAYAATDLANELYNSTQAANGRDDFGSGNKFITPTIADGQVYVGTTTGVGVFGLLNLAAPTIALTSPVNGATYTSPATINLAANVTANGHSITGVKFYNGASLLGTVTSAPYTFSWSNVGAGSDNLSAQLVYDSGSTLNSASVNVTVNPSPTIALTSPANGATYTSPATVNLAANVTANGHSITGVKFYNGANLLGTVTSAPYNYSWSNVGTGSYTLSAQLVYDTSSTLNSGSVNVTVNPSPTIALTSPANGATYTSPATINLAANVTANGNSITGVKFYNGASLLGTVTSAPYNFSWSNVAAGSFTVSAQLVYDSGSTLNSGSANVTVNPGPTIALTSPANGATYTSPATVNLSANVTANGHSITGVSFYNGASLLGTVTSAPYNYSWSNVGTGSYTLSAQLVYDSGSTLNSGSVNVMVNPSPTIALTSPANGATYTSPATVNLSANVTANGHSITGVSFYNGASLLGTVTSAPYNYSWSNVGTGSYTLSAQLVYDSGSTLNSASVNVAVNPIPTIALTSPTNGATYTSPATINLAANVTANGHSITGVNFYNGASLLGTVTSAPYTFSWSNVAAGSYTLSAQLVYDSGSTLNSASVNVTVNPGPTIALTSPANGATYTSPATVNLSANVTANGHSITGVSFYNGASLLGTVTSAPYNYSWSNVGTGSYTLSAQLVYDSGSTLNSASVNVAVNPIPTIALTSPTNGATYTSPATINLAANVTANGHSITGVNFYNGASLLGTVTSAPYNFSWSNVAAGSFTVSAQLVYDSGSTLNSASVNVTVNPGPTIALTSPANGATYTSPATIDLAASIAANGHPITGVNFYNGASLLGTVTSAPYNYSWSNVGAGGYTLSAQLVYDSGSTLNSASVNVTVNPSPTIALTSPANGATYTSPATVNLAANVTANGHSITGVNFYNGATLLGTVTSAPYNYSWSNVGAGSYTLSAQLVYDSGSTLNSASVNVTANPSPTIALTAPANGTTYASPATVNLAANVTANGHSITQVQFYNGSNLLKSVTVAPYTYTWSNIASGNYTLTARLTYDSGSTMNSTPVSVTVNRTRGKHH